SLDSISVEGSFALGPALGVLVLTAVSPVAAVLATGGTVVAAAVALYAMNPPIRSEAELREPGEVPPRRAWLTRALFGVLIAAAGATLVLSGTDVAIVATLREGGQLQLTGVVFAIWCIASAAGGFVHGAV